jgi:hypothetical protein
MFRTFPDQGSRSFWPVLAALMTWSLGVASPVWSQTLTVGLPVAIVPKDVLELTFVEEWEVAGAVHDTLVRYQAGEGVSAALAEKYSWDPKRHRMVFELRPGLKFSNGDPLRAEEVARSFKRILILDRSQSAQIISRCVETKKDIKTLEETHPSIQVVGETRIEFQLLPACSERFLREISNANYGIIHSSVLGSDLKMVRRLPSSGPFVWVEGEGIRALSKNEQSWRWKKSGVPRSKKSIDRIELSLVRPEDGGAAAALAQPDVLRVSAPEALEEYKKNGYHSRISAAIMTWYLSAYGGVEPDSALAAKVIEDLNARLDRASVAYFGTNPLELPETRFFPESFQCRGKVAPKPQKFSAQPLIILVEHGSGESKRFSVQLAARLRALGYPVELIAPEIAKARAADRDSKNSKKNASSKAAKTPEVWLQIRRQFLGDDLVQLFSSLIFQFKAIPDPDQRLSRQTKKIEAASTAQRGPEIQKLCAAFDQYRHVALAHRHYGFLSKKAEYFSLFSSVTGNIKLESAPEIFP